MGMRPKEMLNLPATERRLAMRGAAELEKWRWKQWSKLFGGK